MRKKHHEPASPRSNRSALDHRRAPAALLAFALVGVAASPARAASRAHAPAVPLETRLRIHSTPPDAAVIVDGAHVGLTPYEGTVAPGAHRVTLAHDGHELWSKEIFADGKPIHVGAVLIVATSAAPPPAADASVVPPPAPEAETPRSFDARMSDAGTAAARVGSWPNPAVALALGVAVPLAGSGLGLGLIAADGRSTGLSTVGVAGTILLITAVTIGPSAGHFYSGIGRAPAAHFFIRASGATVGALGGFFLWGSGLTGDPGVLAGGTLLFAAGSLTVLGDIMFELVTTYTHARDLRDERLRTGAMRIGIAPMVSTPWRTAPGVSLSLAY